MPFRPFFNYTHMALVDFSQNPSLNQIVSSLAARVDKPTDTGFMDELKHIVNYKRTAAIHNWLISMPQTWTYFLQSFIVNTEKADATECAAFPTNCFIYVTECQLPEPLRDNRIKKEWQLFDFVGEQSGYRAFQWWQPEAIDLLRHAPFTSKSKKWYWKDGKVYIVSTTDVGATPIQIRGVFEDALTLQRCDICADPANRCIIDDDPYPVPRELLNDIIKDILATELKVGSIPDEVKQDKDDLKTDSVEKIEHVNT